jgi:hypothetical protein
MTAPKPIQVWFEESHAGGAPIRRLLLEGVEGPGGPRVESWWKMPGVTGLPSPPVLDAFVGGHLLAAAMSGQDLVVHGPMSRGGLYNMGQLMAIRRVLSPRLYPRLVTVTPDRVVEAPRETGDPGPAMAALSGGLDSTFTAVRHARRLIGDAAYPLAGLVMVHGFDAALDRPEQFDAMRRRAEPLAEWLGLPLHTVVTNSREHGGRAWPQSAIPLTASALAQFWGRACVGLVSSGAPYGTPRFGVSHPPVLDALSSNDFFRVVTDGGGFGRTDKIEALLPFPGILAGIKVCWEGPDPSRNCGHCQKCVMTRLNFLAAGMPDAPCFETPLALAHIAGLRLPSIDAARDLFRNCWNELILRGRSGPAVRLLTRRLAKVPPDCDVNAFKQAVSSAARILPRRVRDAIRWRPRVLRS